LPRYQRDLTPRAFRSVYRWSAGHRRKRQFLQSRVRFSVPGLLGCRHSRDCQLKLASGVVARPNALSECLGRNKRRVGWLPDKAVDKVFDWCVCIGLGETFFECLSYHRLSDAACNLAHIRERRVKLPGLEIFG